ncbi:MAG: hypothetical protein U0K92_07615 [Treponema sp.]|nr:hypothetical protein [Treponema sp.]
MKCRKNLSPFKWYCLENFPFLEAYIDGYDEYQLLCKLYEQLNKNNEKVNAMGVQVENLTDFVNTYFEDLDVQEEINNKLNEMAESGQLQEIMADYLNANTIWTFDTVQDMKNSENLVNGSFVKTYGYRNIDDGGASFYKVRTVTTEDVIDNMLIISLPNNPTLIAELQTDKGELYPEQCGAYGDGINDDITFLNACRDICISKKLQFKGNPSKIYAVSEGFTLLSGCDYDFQNAKIKALAEMQYVVRNHKTRTTEEPVDNRFTKNLVIECEGLADYGFYQDTLGWSELTDNIRVRNHKLIGIYIQAGQIRLHNSKVEQDNSIYSIGVQVESTDSEYFNIITRDCSTGFKITAGNMLNEMHPVMFNTALLPNSRAFELSANAIFIRPIIDTFQYGFYCTHAGGFTAINPILAINKTYYNETTMTVNPTMLYCTNQNQARITIISASMGIDTILNNEFPIFTNLTSWISNNLLLLNPSLAFTPYQRNTKTKNSN